MENFDWMMIAGAVIVALGGVFAMGIKWAVNKVEDIVLTSENTLDDKVWASAKDGIREALEELAEENKPAE